MSCVLNHLYHYEGLFQLEMIQGILSVFVISLLESSITWFVYGEAYIINLRKKYSTSYTVCLMGSHSAHVIIDFPKLVLQTQSLRVSSRSSDEDLWESMGFCEIIWSVRVFSCMYIWVYKEARGQSNAVPLQPLPHQTGWPVSTASLHHPASLTTSHILLWVLGIKLRSSHGWHFLYSVSPMDRASIGGLRASCCCLGGGQLWERGSMKETCPVRSLWNCHRCFFTHLQEMNDGRVLCFLGGCYLSIGTKGASMLLSLHTKASKANICLEPVARNNCWRAVWGY